MNLIQSIGTKSNFVIPVVLFLGSFFIYSYSLEGQPWHGDEVVYLGQAGEYAQLIKNGDLGNSCLRSIDNCDYLMHIPAYGLTYSPLRNVLIGFPLDVKTDDVSKLYNWSCYWQCYISKEGPTVHEMTTGRLLSPLFGAMTISISFMIGKILFNRYLGVITSLLFLFYDLWLWYSRTIMTEVHYVFFAMLSLLLLLYSFKTGTMRIKYFISSAVAFGLALTSKILSVEFLALFVCIILFGWLFKKEPGNFTKKKDLPKIGLSVLVFFAITALAFFLTQPGFYENPLNQISATKQDMDNYNRDVWFIGYPSIHGISTDRILLAFHYVLFPSFIDHQIPGAYPNSIMKLGWYNPQTYSSVVLTVFFFIGFGYIIHRIIKSKNFQSEALLLVWFISTFIFSLLIAKDFSLERYLLPLTISIIFIASYGLWRFIKDVPFHKTRIVFVVCSVFAHSVTALSYWHQIFFSPGSTWTNPLEYGSLQESLDNPLTLAVNVVFASFFIFILIIRFRLFKYAKDRTHVISKP